MDGKNCLNIYDVTRPIFTIPRYLPQPKISNTFVHKSLISPGSIIEAQTIENSIIGPQSYIKKGTQQFPIRSLPAIIIHKAVPVRLEKTAIS